MVLAESSQAVSASRGTCAFVTDDDVRTVTSLRGDHDLFTTSSLSEAFATAIALDDGHLVVDLHAVTFMDGATIGTIVSTRDRLQDRSRSMVVRNPSRCARRILEVCDLAHLIEGGGVEPIVGTEPTGALASWVAVPAIEVVDARDEPADRLHPSRVR
jgi:anti-anti-sigma factor